MFNFESLRLLPWAGKNSDFWIGTHPDPSPYPRRESGALNEYQFWTWYPIFDLLRELSYSRAIYYKITRDSIATLFRNASNIPFPYLRLSPLSCFVGAGAVSFFFVLISEKEIFSFSVSRALMGKSENGEKRTRSEVGRRNIWAFVWKNHFYEVRYLEPP